jgi:hypothetical protein
MFPVLAPSSIALILLTGIYLAATARAWTFAWIQVSLGAMFLIGFLGAMAGARMRPIRKTAASGTGASLDTYRRSVADPALQIPVRTRLTAALAIVLLMVTRPGMNTSLMIVGVAFAAGLLWSVPTWGRKPLQRATA